MPDRPQYLFAVIQVVAAVVIGWLLIAWKTPWNFQRYFGTVLAVLGVGFIGLARYQLGKSFSARAEAHELVTHGLYSKIRNPIYVFGAVMFAGLLLVAQRRDLWIVFVLMIVVQVIRARREACVLEAAFGDAYRDYRSKTWF